MDTETMLKWKEIILDQQKSGRSVYSYCKENRLSQSSFYKYKKNLEKLGAFEEDFNAEDIKSSSDGQAENIEEKAENAAESVAENALSATEKQILCLIDTENIGKEWPSFILNNPGITGFVLFYTVASTGISVPDFMILMRSGLNIEAISCYTGKNALDFQLVTYLGSMCALHPDWGFCILSNDTGYDSVVKFWTDRGISIARCKVRDRIASSAVKADNAQPDEYAAEKNEVSSKPKTEKRSDSKSASKQAKAKAEKESAPTDEPKEENAPAPDPADLRALLISAGCEDSDATAKVADIVSAHVNDDKDKRKNLIYQDFLSVFDAQNGQNVFKVYQKAVYAVLRSCDENGKKDKK